MNKFAILRIKPSSNALFMFPLRPGVARKRGYCPLTFSYAPGETAALKQAVDALARGKIKHAIVETKKGRQLWRIY